VSRAGIGPDAFETSFFEAEGNKVSDISAGPTAGLWGAISGN
jgi:hypothetical protein